MSMKNPINKTFFKCFYYFLYWLRSRGEMESCGMMCYCPDYSNKLLSINSESLAIVEHKKPYLMYLEIVFSAQ